jgi:hypothetical protein
VPFDTTNDHFAKTGSGKSGQSKGKHSTRNHCVFSQKLAASRDKMLMQKIIFTRCVWNRQKNKQTSWHRIVCWTQSGQMIVIYICKFDPYIPPTHRRCLLCVVLSRAFRGVLSTDARRCFLGWAAAVQYELRQQADQVSKRQFRVVLHQPPSVCQRQARDRHRENSKIRLWFCRSARRRS